MMPLSPKWRYASWWVWTVIFYQTVTAWQEDLKYKEEEK